MQDDSALYLPKTVHLLPRRGQPFEFEGERLSYSAMREVDYQNQDLEVGIYYNSTGFAAGTYQIQLYCEGRLIGQTQVVMK